MDSLEAKPNLHIAIRSSTYGDTFYERLKGDIIKDHNVIVGTKGHALLGKLGRAPGSNKLSLLRASIKTYHKANLFIVRRTKQGGYEAFAAPIRKVHSENDFTPSLSLVPPYYHHIVPSIKLWFDIERFEKIEDQRLQSLVLLSNGRPLLDVLAACRTSSMLVLEETN